MQGLRPFISFGGNCEEAMRYYEKALGGKIISIQHFDQGPMDVPEEFKKHVMFCEFHFGPHALLASDCMPGQKVVVGDNISLSVGTTELEITKRWFDSLSQEGTITMPLQDTFWGATFGMLTDKYGIQWMFNCEKK